ncbi:MAG: hypothetical protein U9Q73_02560 [Nanoarchaeota archaeon]|nr:hypothetical protein [Nanoarchaeota archaeon]
MDKKFIMMNKKGAIHYELIISLILGLIFLGLSMYFIFIEYWNEDELDWQQCRQSVILRSNLPNLKELGTDLKGSFPLKCKTEVVTIDSAEPNETYGKISKAVASGWYMFGEGKFDFVHRSWLVDNRYCLVFARIHSTADNVQTSNEAVDENSINTDTNKKKFTQGFYDYYIETKMPGRKETYNDYLPMLGSNKPSPRFILSSEIDLQEEDIALVYVMNKYSTLVTKVVSNIPLVWVSSKIVTGKSPSELFKKMEKVNFIWMVPMSDLDKIECTRYLTIPA